MGRWEMRILYTADVGCGMLAGVLSQVLNSKDPSAALRAGSGAHTGPIHSL
jgi:hypothetical protein